LRVISFLPVKALRINYIAGKYSEKDYKLNKFHVYDLDFKVTESTGITYSLRMFLISLLHNLSRSIGVVSRGTQREENNLLPDNHKKAIFVYVK